MPWDFGTPVAILDGSPVSILDMIVIVGIVLGLIGG